MLDSLPIRFMFYCFLVSLVISPFFKATAQSLPNCSLEYGETIERVVYGEGTILCHFEGSANDNITVECLYCDGMRLTTASGVRIEDMISGPGTHYILPQTGTYIVTIHYSLVRGWSESRCVNEQDYYDNDGNFMYSMCVEYEMEPNEENYAENVQFVVDVLGGSGPSSQQQQRLKPTEIPLLTDPVTIHIDELCPDSDGQIQIALQLNALEIVDADEADSGTSIVGGDEVYLYYGIGVDDGTDMWDMGRDGEYFFTWSGDLARGDLITEFEPMIRVVDCGKLTVIIIAAEENDGFFGSTTLGIEQAEMSFTEGEQVELIPETEVIFSGTSIDGTYDYRIRYTVALSTVGGNNLEAALGQ